MPISYIDDLLEHMKNNHSNFKNLESIHGYKNYINRSQPLPYAEKVDINKILNRIKLDKKNEIKNILLKCIVAISLVIFTIIITRF